MPGGGAIGQNLVHIDTSIVKVCSMCLLVQHAWRHTLTHTYTHTLTILHADGRTLG